MLLSNELTQQNVKLIGETERAITIGQQNTILAIAIVTKKHHLRCLQVEPPRT